MKPSPQSHPVHQATVNFVAGVLPSGPCRLEARVSSREGMPLLCLVETALAQALPRSAAQELVWLKDPPPEGRDVLRLQAFGPNRELLAEAVHEFAIELARRGACAQTSRSRRISI